MIFNTRYNVLLRLMLKHSNHVEMKMISCKKPSFVVDCGYLTVGNHLWDTQITDEVELDKSVNEYLITL